MMFLFQCFNHFYTGNVDQDYMGGKQWNELQILFQRHIREISRSLQRAKKVFINKGRSQWLYEKICSIKLQMVNYRDAIPLEIVSVCVWPKTFD